MNKVHNQKKVTVVIPTYNRASFIPNAVRSIETQEYNNIEIIIVDDGSNDNTQSVVNSLQKQYSNIFYCHNERSKGPSGARNTGIIKSSGDYLSFLDSDDIWLDDHLINGLKILTKHPEIDVLFGNFSVVDFHTGKHQYNFCDQKKILHGLKSVRLSPNIRILQDNLFHALIQENFFHLGSSIIRKSSTDKIILDESIMFSEDRDFAIRLYKDANATFAYREDPVFIQYRHDSNFYSGGDLNTRQRVVEAHLYLFTKYLRIYNLSNDEKKTLNRNFANRLSNLSSIYRGSKEHQKALSYSLKSFEYGLSFNQVKELIKALITLTLNSKCKTRG